MIKGINHIGISVSDLDRSIDFYRNLLGMEVVVRRPFDGPQYEEVLALPGTRGMVALLRSATAQIELFEFVEPAPVRANARRPVSDYGITHLCIEVTDIESEYARLKSRGIDFH